MSVLVGAVEPQRMKITQDVREFAAAHGMAEDEAVRAGLDAKAAEFRQAGGQLYGEPEV